MRCLRIGKKEMTQTSRGVREGKAFWESVREDRFREDQFR